MSDAVQLPMGWAWAAVSDVAIDLRYGTSAKTASDINGVPVLRMGNLTSNGEIILDEFKFLPADHPDLAGASLSVGDILFNRTNSFELVGKSAVYLGNPDPCSFASYLIRLRLNPTCLPKYLAFALNSHLGKAWVKKVVSQQVGQANVNGTKLRSFTFPLPPLAEQRRIVAEIENQFTRLDAAVAALRRAKTRLRHFRAVVLHLACGPKEGWKKTQLLDAIDEIRNGISVKPTKAEGIPILRISSVRPMTVDLQDVRFLPDAPEYTRYRLRDGDLLFTRYNGNANYVGVAGCVRNLKEDLVYPDKLIRVRLKDEGPLSPAFVEVAVNAGSARDFLRSRIRTTAGQSGISGADIKTCPIWFPSCLQDQQEIAARVQDQLSMAEAIDRSLEANLTRANRLRQSILKRAFEGKLVPQDPMD